MSVDARVFELRRYLLHPGARDRLIELFERSLLEPQQRAGMEIVGTFTDPQQPGVFIWIRSFPDMGARRVALAAFYDGPVWHRNRDAANATMIDSDNVLLLCGDLSAGTKRLPAPLFCAIYRRESAERLSEFATEFDSNVAPQMERDGMQIVARWVTDPSENDFPRLPVRTDAVFLVALVAGAKRAALAATAPDELFELVPTRASQLQVG